MRTNRSLYPRLLVLAITALSIMGCKVQITAPEGGQVISKSGAYQCQSGQVCTIDIHDLFFDEEFTGEPAPGYSFFEWRKVDRSLCAYKTTPCRIVSAWAQIHEVFMELLESDDVFYLEAVFIDDLGGSSYTGVTSQALPIALTVRDDTIIRARFTYQQLGEIPPDPYCRHQISVDLSAPVNADGTFAVDIGVPAQTSDSGKLQLVEFEGRLSGSVENSEGTGRWDMTEMEILCEKRDGETLRNFCGEDFFPCIDAVDLQFNVERAQ